MSESASLYRRHRPGSFAEVVGQQHVVRTLQNAVEQGKVHHAYLFVGSRGTGKTSMAKILARSLNCENGGPTVTPCGHCESCVTIASGTSIDVIEMDAASNRSVDDVRDLRERVAYAPAGGRWKVYILDEAHMLTKEAWNAFLKTLEEPPPNTVFVLATTESHKVMATIADRCQRFDFGRPSIEQLGEVIRRVSATEGFQIEDGAVALIARSASGSFRDALGTLDQLVAFGGTSVTLDSVLQVLGAADSDLLFEALDAVGAEDPSAALAAVERMANSGRDPNQYARDLLDHLRHLLVTQTTGTVPETFIVTADDAARLHAQAAAVGPATLVRTIDELSLALSAVREGDDARLAIEIALLKAARPDLDPSTEGLLRRIERLEERLAAGSAPAPTAPTPVPVPEAVAEEPSAPDPEDAGPPEAGDDESYEIEAEAPAAEPEPEAEAPPEPESVTEPEPEPSAPDAEEEALPAAVTPVPEGEISLDHLYRVWPAIIEQMRTSGAMMLSALYEGAHPTEVDAVESTITIGFPASATFNKRKAEAPDQRDRFAEAVETTVGRRLRPLYVLLEAGATAPFTAGGPVEGDSVADDEDALLEKLKSEFDAEEVG